MEVSRGLPSRQQEDTLANGWIVFSWQLSCLLIITHSKLFSLETLHNSALRKSSWLSLLLGVVCKRLPPLQVSSYFSWLLPHIKVSAEFFLWKMPNRTLSCSGKRFCAKHSRYLYPCRATHQVFQLFSVERASKCFPVNLPLVVVSEFLLYIFSFLQQIAVFLWGSELAS